MGTDPRGSIAAAVEESLADENIATKGPRGSVAAAVGNSQVDDNIATKDPRGSIALSVKGSVGTKRPANGALSDGSRKRRLLVPRGSIAIRGPPPMLGSIASASAPSRIRGA